MSLMCAFFGDKAVWPRRGTGIVTPMPTQDGMVSTCDTFYLVQDGDGCYDIATSYDITLGELCAWNSAVDDCSDLWPDYYVW